MGLFDFFKRRAKNDESEKTAEKQPDTETTQTDESAPKADEASDSKVAQTQAETVSTANNDSSKATADTTPEQLDKKAAAPSEKTEDQNTDSSETGQTADETAPQAAEPQSLATASSTDEQPQAVTEQEPQPDAVTAENSEQSEPTEAERYDKGLEKSRLTFGQRLNHLLANFRSVDEGFFDDLEETLIGADVGFDMAMKISDELREEVKLKNVKKSKDVQNVVVEKLIELYDQAGSNEQNGLTFAKEGPTVILFVGVNGVGKTTTIGKMANLFKQQGKKVLLAAADTFRAGAIEQLNVWAERDGVDIVKKPEKSDPSAVVYDALKKAKSENYDILFVDTAGRLQNKTNLMNELAKMKRVITREIPDAPHEVLLVLDATTGQNALNQAKMFKEATDVSGIVLTKLDGTARGGIVLAIRNELHLPVKYVGLGEHVDDLRPFEPSEFVYGLFKGLIDVE
ncbi:cell division protein FtsY [Secundilactobacillus pentosiphilus]|uniref:Signal recognition particle receptor FtsY n=1 Tax=Secundilactobacillus pentosiphilus TaxID=1714682 RepID=A0A1Z5IV54_9LACO|nr:signal recognition particle-docking protein FtsY [Secundilactobacillus pentosiphilus]GAX05488.1 cell division protein FtsY [Secundilactobacillus pentosiphilus]